MRGPLWILLGLLVWLAIDPLPFAPRLLLGAMALAGVTAAVYAVPAAASGRLNRRRQPDSPIEASPSPTALVLLSGRVETIRGSDGRTGRALTPSCAARVREAARVWALIAPAWIVSTGGLVRPDAQARPAADMMRDRLIELGVPPSTITVEPTSRDTHQSAVNTGVLLRRWNAERIVVVTSAVHMRRAIGAFRALGFDPLPAPAPDPDRPRTLMGRLLPSRSGLRFSAEVLHEGCGIVYYRLRGWYRG